MTLFAVAGRARVTDVKMRASQKAGVEIVVGIAFARSGLSEAERASLQDYYGNYVDVELAACRDRDDPARLPLDEALARVEGRDGRTERGQPGPEDTCRGCGKAVGDDPRAGFHVPLAGPPSPLCGACLAERLGKHEARNYWLNVADGQDVDVQSDRDEADEEELARDLDLVRTDDPPGDAEPPSHPITKSGGD